jgi:hypothetical protein
MSKEADIGRVLLGLQENLANIKQAMSGVQGPSYLPQLAALHQHIDRIEKSLKSGAESCLNALVTNSGQTVQELPSIKSRPSKRSQLAVVGEMRVRDVRSSYLKREVYVPRHKQSQKRRTAEVPPASEDDLNSGLLSLVYKGKIPKNVDLMPASIRGAPPLASKPVKMYEGSAKTAQTFNLVGATKTHLIKYDFAPAADVQARQS